MERFNLNRTASGEKFKKRTFTFNAIKSLLIGGALVHAAVDTESAPVAGGTPTEQTEAGSSRIKLFGFEVGATEGIRGTDQEGHVYVNPLRILAPTKRKSHGTRVPSAPRLYGYRIGIAVASIGQKRRAHPNAQRPRSS